VKILVSAFQCCPGEGSEPRTGWQWVTALADFGHDVTVLASSHYREPLLAQGRKDIDWRFIDIPPSPLPRGLSFRLWAYDGYRRWQDAALKAVQLNPEHFDVTHHVTWASLHLGSKLWRLPAPLVYGPIGGGQTAPARYRSYFGSDWRAEKLRTAATGSLLKVNGRSRETLQNSAVTLVCNADTEAAAHRMGAARVRYMLCDALLPSWIVDPRRQPDGTPVVVWVGRMLPRKAPTLVVEAFAELRRRMPARLVMAGDGPLAGEVRAAVARLGVTDDVELRGHISWDEVRGLYDDASVFLFPSLRESFGAQFLEALGRGLPAVTLDHHGIADVDTGIAAIKVPLPDDPRDLPGELGTALETVLADGQWESRSEAAIKWASQQTWPVRAAEATAVYQEYANVAS
jgi:glycosyltransferase involved in cell wall biosynthesis